MANETLETTLLDLEKRSWYGDSAVYEESLTDDSLLVFAEPIGVLSKNETIASAAGSQRWTDVCIDDTRLRILADTVAILTYQATAKREDTEQPYNTVATSVYVNDGGSRKLAHHQQTPDQPRNMGR